MHEPRPQIWLPIATCALFALMPDQAAAQAVTGAAAEDPASVVDSNNVNLSNGKLSLTSRDVSIGDAPGLSSPPCWSDGGWNPRRTSEECGSSVAGGVRELMSNLEEMDGSGLQVTRHWDGGAWRTNWTSNLELSSGRYTVTFGNQNFYFSGPAGGYQSTRGDGATLTPLGSNAFRVTTREGTTIEFPSVTSHYYTSPLTGPATSVTYPNGRIVTITYAKRAGCGTPSCADSTYLRVQQISSSDNYGLLFEYSSDDGTANNMPAWAQPTRITAFNRVVDACPTTQMHCSFTQSWPAANYSVVLPTSTVMTTTSPGSRTTTYQLTSGRVTRITNPDGNIVQDISYYPQTNIPLQNLVNTVTRGAGTWTYVPSSKPTLPTTIVTMTVTDPLGGVTVSKADGKFGIREVTDQLSRRTVYAYDTQTRLVSTTRPSGAATVRTYDARGNVTEVRRIAAPGSGNPDIVVSATYPSTCANQRTCNKPLTTTDARGFTTDYTYDPAHGGMLTATRPAAPNGVRPQARMTYTQIGGIYRLTETASCRTLATCAGTADELRTIIAHGGSNFLPASITTTSGTGSPSAAFTVGYDDLGNLATVTGPLGGTEYLFYDLDRRPTGTIGADPDGANPLPRRGQRYTYNASGQVTNIERGSLTGTTSAALASMIAVINRATGYDSLGRKAWEADQAGGIGYTMSQFSYDIAGRPECTAVRMNPALFGSLPFSACILGSPAGADGPDRITRTYYDAAAQMIRIQRAHATSEQVDEQSMTYTLNGEFATLTDAENNRTTYEYDGHDRLVKTRFPVPAMGSSASSTTDYELVTLDPAGNVTQRRLRDGQLIGYTFDQLDRMVAKDLPSPESDVSYAHDLHGRLLAATQGSATLGFGYDALGRLVSETGAQGAMGYEHDLLGRRTRTTWPDGFFVTRDYLETGELLAVRANGAASGPGVLATYSYDPIGRPTGLLRGNGALTTSGYDPVSRPASLAHDAAGTADDVTTTFAYNPANQIRQQVRDNDAYAWTAHYAVNRSYVANGLNQLTMAGTVPLSYLDLRGNLTNSGSNIYAYTAENRLISAPGGVALGYDPMGRLAHTAGAATRRFQYDREDIVAEYDSSNALLRRYVHGTGADNPLVWYEGAGIADPNWLHADERGSVIGVSNASGAMIARTAYDEYGIPAGAYVGRFQYTGQIWLPEIGMYHYKARVYSPTLGRFLQTDPIGFEDQVNLYAYVGNDPVNQTDPTGTCTENMCPVSAFFGTTEYNLRVRRVESEAGAIAVPIFVAIIATPLAGEALFYLTASTAYRTIGAYLTRQISWHINRNIRNGLVEAIRAQVRRGIMVGGRDHIAKARNVLGWIRNQVGRINSNPALSAAEKARLIERLERLRRQIQEALTPPATRATR